MNKEKITFSFGKNWNDFIKKYYKQERLDEAIKSLKELYGMDTFEGKTFLDIGCGSGLFSLGAYKMHAKSITSFDIDPYSVQCGQYLHHKENDPANWRVLYGSILDTEWLKQNIENADIVYSWGVLHHTGAMWDAIHNASQFVNPGGKFIIAIYNKVIHKHGSEFWWKTKKKYNDRGKFGKKIMEIAYVAAFLLHPITHARKPKHILGIPKNLMEKILYIKNYKSSRGMNWWTDVKDWLGGFPYEYATREEITEFCEKRGFKLEKTLPNDGTGCNQFLFSKKA